jgi:CheY-like chemotaxis protein
LTPSPRDSARPSALPDRAPGSGVLIVDDETGVRTVLDIGLRHLGLAVWQAAGGREAAEVFRRQPHIHLALLDVRMPDLDGPDTLQILRGLDPTLPCCFMTGYAGKYSDEDLRALGAVHVFRKPFDLDEIGRVLHDLVGCPAMPVSSDAPERRQSARRRSNAVPVHIARLEGTTRSAEGSLVNRSAGGFCLLAREAAEAGTVLMVRVADAADPVPWVEVVVRYRHPQDDRWLLGCQVTGQPSTVTAALGGDVPPAAEAS